MGRRRTKPIKFGNWELKFDGKNLVIVHKTGRKYRIWEKSAGWIDFENERYKGTLYPLFIEIRDKEKDTKGKLIFMNYYKKVV